MARSRKATATTTWSSIPNTATPTFALGLYNYYVDIAPTFLKVLRVLLFLPAGNRAEG